MDRNLATANRLLVSKLKQESPDNDTPEQRLIRLTMKHPEYSLDYSFPSYSNGWLVSDIGMKTSTVMMKSTEMIAVDCEMVLCEDGTDGLVRVAVVDRDLRVILDKFVKPDKPVVDYRTLITGVAAQDIENVTFSVVDVQKVLQTFLSNGAILVGHSLNKDMKVMKIDHPKVIDTALVFKFSNARNSRKPSLNDLCKAILGNEVRKEGVSHDCVQDAIATMKVALAFIEKGFNTTISPTREVFFVKKLDLPKLLFCITFQHLQYLQFVFKMLEAEKSRLFLHRISYCVTSEKLNTVLAGQFRSREFKLDVKPTKGGYYCAVVVFDSSEAADRAFKNVGGHQETDSSGLPQKMCSWGSMSSFYVRKMA